MNITFLTRFYAIRSPTNEVVQDVTLRLKDLVRMAFSAV